MIVKIKKFQILYQKFLENYLIKFKKLKSIL